MTIDNWQPYYRIDPVENQLFRSNMLYTPLVNPEGTVFCMNWDATNDYQLKYGDRGNFSELIDFFFAKETANLSVFKNMPWAPELLDIDLSNKQIFFKWYGGTCNNVVYGGGDLNTECPNWQTQLHTIVEDIYTMGYYKPSLYPHCFYIDIQGTLRTFDFYACIPRANPYVKFDLIRGMVGPNSMGRFDEAMSGDEVNVEILFKRALEHYIKWPDDALLKIYKKMFL